MKIWWFYCALIGCLLLLGALAREAHISAQAQELSDTDTTPGAKDPAYYENGLRILEILKDTCAHARLDMAHQSLCTALGLRHGKLMHQ